MRETTRLPMFIHWGNRFHSKLQLLESLIHNIVAAGYLLEMIRQVFFFWGGVTATNDHSIWGERKVSHESFHILSLCFAAKYHNDRLWQVDMKIPRRNVGVPGDGYSAPIRDRNSLWPGGIIPYTVAYSIRKLVPLALNARRQQRTHFWKLLIYLRF